MTIRTDVWRRLFIQYLTVLTICCWMPGCGQKVPTFGELVNGKTAEPTPPPVAPAPMAPTAPVETAQGPTPAEIIAGFSKIPTFEVTDANLQQLASLPSGKEAIGELKLSGSKVTNEGLAALPNLPNLATDRRQRPRSPRAVPRPPGTQSLRDKNHRTWPLGCRQKSEHQEADDHQQFD